MDRRIPATPKASPGTLPLGRRSFSEAGKPGDDDDIFRRRVMVVVPSASSCTLRTCAGGPGSPPKIFPQATPSAPKPNPRAPAPPVPTIETPTASNAPTTITDEIALVTDIS